MNEQEDEKVHVLNIIYEVLDSFGTVIHGTSGDGIIRLRRNNKMFGLILNKEIYLRVKRPFFFLPYPPETYAYDKLKFRRLQLKVPVDKEDLLQEIYKSYLITCGKR